MAAFIAQPTSSVSERRHLHPTLLALVRRREHDHTILPGLPFH